MGFVVSSSSFLCSPMSAPSSHHAPSSPLLLLCPKRRSTAKKVFAVSSSDGDGDLSGSSSNRRAILLVGVSVLPLFHLRAIAVENLVKGLCANSLVFSLRISIYFSVVVGNFSLCCK